MESGGFILSRAMAQGYELSRWQLNEMHRRALIERTADDQYNEGTADIVVKLLKVRPSATDSYEMWGFIAAINGIPLPSRFWTENVAAAEQRFAAIGKWLGVGTDREGKFWLLAKAEKTFKWLSKARSYDPRFSVIRRRVGKDGTRTFLRMAAEAGYRAYEPYWDENESGPSLTILGRATGLTPPKKKKAIPQIPDDPCAVSPTELQTMLFDVAKVERRADCDSATAAMELMRILNHYFLVAQEQQRNSGTVSSALKLLLLIFGGTTAERFFMAVAIWKFVRNIKRVRTGILRFFGPKISNEKRTISAT